MLEVRGLETSYGRSQVLFGVSFEISAGEVVSLLGRNGMGKTTTVKSIMGITRPRAGHSFRFWRDARTDPALIGPAKRILDDLGLAGRSQVLAGNLAHGEQRQLEVAIALATSPRLLLLDEPMAGMGIEESQRLIELLASLKRRHTIILIEHDMDAVFRLADRISVLVYGRLIATGTPEKIRANEEVRRAYLGTQA